LEEESIAVGMRAALAAAIDKDKRLVGFSLCEDSKMLAKASVPISSRTRTGAESVLADIVEKEEK